MSDAIPLDDENTKVQKNPIKKIEQKQLKTGAIQKRAALVQLNNLKVTNRTANASKGNIKKDEKDNNDFDVQSLKSWLHGAVKDAVSKNQDGPNKIDIQIQFPHSSGINKKVIEKPQQEFKKPVIPAVEPRVDTRWRKETNQQTVEYVRRSLRLAKIQSSKENQSVPEKSNLESVKGYQLATKTVSVAQSWTNILIEGVRDIDDCDKNKVELVSAYANDIFEYLFQLELKQPIYKSHLKNQLSLTPTMRAKLMDWLNEIHAGFHLVLETYFMAVSLVDRYTQKVKDTKCEEYQLLGVTAMFIAAKYEELYPPKLENFVYISNDYCQRKQIIRMEIRVLKALNCKLSRPLPIHFLRRFSQAADATEEVHTMAKYFLELSSIAYGLAAYRPSEISAASLWLALHICTGDAQQPTGINPKLWNATLQHYSHYSAKHLCSLLRKIAIIVRDAPNAKLTVVYKKYQSSKFHKISLRSELYGDLMNSIVKHK